MGNKNIFDVSQTRGIQYFMHEREALRVMYFGAEMQGNSIVNGEVMFVQRADGTFWMGRTYLNMYWLEMSSPIDKVLTGLSYLSQEKRMLEMHESEDGDGMFVDQGELPF